MKPIFRFGLAAVVAIGAAAPFAALALTAPPAAPQSSALQPAFACRRPASVACMPGTHGVPGGINAHGCRRPSRCVADAQTPPSPGSPTACPLPPSVGCIPGTHGVPGGTDANGCRLPSVCVPD
ncbi:MAG: hypothetical protein ACHQAY_27505 [Hyphomicrobiales bacterium]